MLEYGKEPKRELPSSVVGLILAAVLFAVGVGVPALARLLGVGP